MELMIEKGGKAVKVLKVIGFVISVIVRSLFSTKSQMGGAY